MIRERIFESRLLCAELKVDPILRGAAMQGATIYKSYELGVTKEVRIVKNNER